MGDEGFPSDSVSTYWKDHPYSKNFGGFKELYRADNLAAYGVGHGIATEIKRLPIWRKIEVQSRRGEKVLTNAEREQMVKDVGTILKDLFSNEAALARRVNKYHTYFEEKSGIAKVTIPVDALFFIPEYGGFNTDGLKINAESVYTDKPTSRLYFEKTIEPAYNAYVKNEKAASRPPLGLDQWLRVSRENYVVSKPKD